MSVPLNQDIGGRLEEVAQLLAEQGASRFRVRAYARAARVLRALPHPVSEIYARHGIAGLEEMPGIGPSIARAIRDIIVHGHLPLLERLRGEHDPVALLRSVPGIGKVIAWKLHDDLGIESLADLEAAAHDGRLETLAGLGAKRLAGIRDSLAHRLGRVRASSAPTVAREIPIAELLEVDREYARAVADDSLRKIAPRRFNPAHDAWLPVLHTVRGPRHYTALFSNSARAHDLGRTRDWVVLYADGPDGEQQNTIITAQYGDLRGLRIVRGREEECRDYYFRGGQPPMSRLLFPQFANA